MKQHLLQGRALVAAVVLSIALAACGGGEESGPSATPRASGQPPATPQLHCAP